MYSMEVETMVWETKKKWLLKSNKEIESYTYGNEGEGT